MACTLKFANNLFFSNVTLKNKIFSRVIVCSRQYCSKDDKNDPAEDILSKEKHEKHTKESPENLKIKTAKVQTKDSQAAAKEKLMTLLSEIKISSDVSPRTTTNLNLARPLKRPTKKERYQKMKDEERTPEKELASAVKAVASSFKEDPGKIELELTQKLKTLKMAKETVPEEPADIDSSKFDNKLNENLMSSVEGVAAAISESPIPPRSELAKRLLRMSLEQKDSPEKKISMRSAIEKMKFQPKRSPPSKRWEYDERRKPEPKPQVMSAIDLFGDTPLNIFKLDSDTKTDSGNQFWQKLQEKELCLLTQFAPTNGFEEMILWTEQGKHWKFPIDNETEMGAEEKVGFHEHVFLEHHLKGFPERGPVRQFMDLVVVGLSKNPYMTVDRKLENIEWFRNYFKEKEDILKEAGALD